MKKLNDLLIERSDKIGEMSTILTTAREAKRERTDEEKTTWQRLNGEVEGLSAEIIVQETQARLDKEDAGKRELEKPEAEAIRRYDLSKAIMSVGNQRNLEGLEAEMHQEAEREVAKVTGVSGNILIPSMIVNRAYTKPSERANEETKTTGLAAGHIPLAVGDPNFVVPTPLYREMGCTVYEGLGAGKLDLPFSQGHTAAAIAEAGNSLQSVPTDTKGTLSATRYGGWQDYTAEYLAESALMPQMFADMIAAVDRGVGSALVLDAVAVAIKTGFAASDTKAALTWPIVLAIMAGLTSDSFVSEGFVMSKSVFYKLASTVVGTDQSMVNKFLSGNNRGMIGGIKSAGTGFLPVHDTDKYDFIYGDWKQGFVGFWGGAQLLVDPFSQAVAGYTRIHFNRIGAVDSNPYAFQSYRNVDSA